MPPRSSTSARVLAPAALVACAALLLFVLATSGGGDADKGGDKANGSQTQTSKSSRPRRRRAQGPQRPQGGTYTVKAGDTLGSISEKTGVGVEQLQELNPQLDPQALGSGQKLKLRE